MNSLPAHIADVEIYQPGRGWTTSPYTIEIAWLAYENELNAATQKRQIIRAFRRFKRLIVTCKGQSDWIKMAAEEMHGALNARGM